MVRQVSAWPLLHCGGWQRVVADLSVLGIPAVHLGCRSLNWHDGGWHTNTTCSPNPYHS